MSFLRILPAIAITLSTASVLPAQSQLISSRNDISGATLDWSMVYFPSTTLVTTVPTPTGIPGLTVAIASPGTTMLAKQQPGSWNGNFNPGESVIYGYPGPIEFVFSGDIFKFGANVQSLGWGNFVGFITAYDAVGNLVGSFSSNGVSTGAADGSAIFLGIGSSTGFRRIVVNADLYGVAMNQASFEAQVHQPLPPQSQLISEGELPVIVNPEPGTVALLGAGMLVLGAGYRRRRTS